ncbi:hypothetical protein HJFPF1_12615 [Paramyrothecium foliicola]|nr:hypothetical protein HJFPF1_12615 [Paramyrothecium foliicola]
MATQSPIPAYVLGTACIGRGVMALVSPSKEYGHVGLPLEPVAEPKYPSQLGSASPLMYLKGIREISYGTIMVALQLQKLEDALTTVAAVLTFVRLGDGLIVWLHEGNDLRFRAWGHWITGAAFAGWVGWRLR